MDLFLKPAEGRRVPMPDGSPWPAEGAVVTPDRYVRRRIADGDLVPATLPEQTAADPAPEATTDEPARKKR